MKFENIDIYKHKIGVYKITNIVTNKYYIGSSSVSFYTRYLHHRSELRRNKHKNKRLQNSWNKHTESNFVFSVIEECDKNDIESREQYFINVMNATNNIFGYNINPLASRVDTSSVEFKLGRKKTSEILKERSRKFKLWKSKLIADSELSDKELSCFKDWLKPAWNKGKSHSEDIRKKLSESAKCRKITKEGSIKRKTAIRKKLPEIYVYKDNTLVGVWNSIPDLCDESKNKDFKLINYMTFRNPKGRNGYEAHILKSFNVNKSIKTKNLYKGLLFSNVLL